MTDPLASLRNVKVPLWARALGWWRNRQRVKAEKSRTIFVCTVRGWVWHHGDKRHIFGWYNLYRNGYGKRWYEYGHNHPSIAGWDTLHSVYGTIVNPWVNGAWCDDEMQDFAKKNQWEPARR